MDTINTLSAVGIKYYGAGRSLTGARAYTVIVKGGVRVAFLGYDDVEKRFRATENTIGTAYCDFEFIKADVLSAKANADIVCVSFHFGVELDHYPTDRQRELAKFAIDCGATVILGHHPHVIQGIEQYSNGIIFYSLGNFCFGGNINPKDKDTIIPIIHVSKIGIHNVEVIPCKISSRDDVNDFIPTIATGNEGRRIMWKLKTRSINMGASQSPLLAHNLVISLVNL